jgi:SAM-dependent MidA family methyltransferase
VTVAAFMDLALYDPRFGYYARAAQRSGRAGDFFTSVDVGAVFGQLLERQIAEMAEILETRFPAGRFDLVEAGAGNGRLSADILREARRRHPTLYDRVHLHLVEASAAARAAARDTLGDSADRIETCADRLPASFEGVLVANELLDALPVHQVVMRQGGLREVYVAVEHSALVAREGPPSTPALADHLARLGVTLEPGWRAEIGLRAVDWMREASRRLRRGFLIVIDYGHAAPELYSAARAGGTLATFSRHTTAGPEAPGAAPPWLRHPGEQDITAHVDFSSVQAAAEAEGLDTLGFLDQTYFVMGLIGAPPGGRDVPDEALVGTLKDRLALKTLLMPGGLGSTLKVLLLGKDVGAPALSGCSYRMRVT